MMHTETCVYFPYILLPVDYKLTRNNILILALKFDFLIYSLACFVSC